MSWWRSLLGQERLPASFTGTLDPDERVLASAPVTTGGALVASSLGMWLPEGRRIGWHLVSKVVWDGGALLVTEAEFVDRPAGGGDDPAGAPAAGGVPVVLLRDLAPRRLPLGDPPGTLPAVVHRRVTDSIRSRHHRDLPGGGAWFVQRTVPGRDGLVLQVRPDPGSDPAAVRRVADQVAHTLRGRAR